VNWHGPYTDVNKKGNSMKTPLLIISSLVGLLLLAGCESMPEKVKNDGQAAAERAKQNAEKAYDDMKEDMK
jgi:starvation-inducible outer membrane lipoprotein